METGANRFVAEVVFSTGHYEYACAAQGLKGLTQPSERNNFFLPEGIQSVDHDDVEVAFHPGMLEGIVEKKHIRCRELSQQDFGCLIAICPDSD